MFPPASTEYTKAELLVAAREAGFSASGRLLTDWVSLGLLDQARRRGLGRGQGTRATWPYEQMRLFLLLLEKRPTVSHIAPLCNIPVFLWLWFGDSYAPLRQVRRALATWSGANLHATSWRSARASAANLTAHFAHPDARPRSVEKFTDTVAQTIYGKPFDAETILETFRDVFDPHGENRSIGPPQVVFRPEYFVTLVKCRLEALSALRAGSIPDHGFTWSRSEYLESRREYLELLPQVAADAEAAEIFFSRSSGGVVLTGVTVEDIANSACVDLLTMLGIYGDSIAPGLSPGRPTGDRTADTGTETHESRMA